MNWFAPKVLKSDYDKVVADNMELKIELEALKRVNEPKAVITKSIKSEKVKEKIVDLDWKAEFSPKFFVRSLLEFIYESEDIHFDKKESLFINKRTNNIAGEFLDGRLIIETKTVLSVYKKMSNKTNINRMPRGSLLHLYNENQIELSHVSNGKYRFSVRFRNNMKYSGLMITENALNDYKNLL